MTDTTEGSVKPSIIRLGTQGWSYRDWVGVFYPGGTPANGYLPFYSQVFDAVELDTTFYALPRPDAVSRWRDETPDQFQFAAKMPGAITHDRRLVGAEAELLEFLEAILGLGRKLGPILIQLPPSLEASDFQAVEGFLEILPTEFRYAIEFRHRSWNTAETHALLQEHNVAWTIIDLHYMPKNVHLTTDFTYVRWLGNRRDVTKLDRVQIDRSGDIHQWAQRLDEIAQKLQRIYGFMNNHYAGHSPASVHQLKAELKIDGTDPRSLWPVETRHEQQRLL
jgi:uncharacterized protein YecE (DUF72 family)